MPGRRSPVLGHGPDFYSVGRRFKDGGRDDEPEGVFGAGEDLELWMAGKRLGDQRERPWGFRFRNGTAARLTMNVDGKCDVGDGLAKGEFSEGSKT